MTDTTRAIDGIAETVEHFSWPLKLKRKTVRRATDTPPTERHRALVAQGYVVKRGKCGATAFWFGGLRG